MYMLVEVLNPGHIYGRISANLAFVVVVCDGVFILSITSKPKKTGLFSLLASCFDEFQLSVFIC